MNVNPNIQNRKLLVAQKHLSLYKATHQMHERDKDNTIADPFFNLANLS